MNIQKEIQLISFKSSLLTLRNWIYLPEKDKWGTNSEDAVAAFTHIEFSKNNEYKVLLDMDAAFNFEFYK